MCKCKFNRFTSCFKSCGTGSLFWMVGRRSKQTDRQDWWWVGCPVEQESNLGLGSVTPVRYPLGGGFYCFEVTCYKTIYHKLPNPKNNNKNLSLINKLSVDAAIKWGFQKFQGEGGLISVTSTAYLSLKIERDIYHTCYAMVTLGSCLNGLWIVTISKTIIHSDKMSFSPSVS